MDPKDLKTKLAREFATAKGIDGILLLNTGFKDANFVYLTDFRGGLYEDSFLFVERAGVTLFTDMREYEGALKERIQGMRIVELDSKKKVEVLINKVKGKRIGINGSFIPYLKYRDINKKWKPKALVDVTESLEKARCVKERYELERISKANSITKKAILVTQKNLKVGMTEKEAARFFDDLIMKLGADGNSFESIVCFGRNAAIPHHSPDNTRLKYGDFVLIDVGVKVRNYCSDVTRTIIFGNDRKRIKDYGKKARVIEVVAAAQKKAMAAIRAGANGGKVHMIVQDYIDSADGGAYKGTFGHSLGHSIGVEVHDGSGRFLGPSSNLILKEGMVSSVEPGIYIPGFGGARIEDDIVVTKNGCKIL